MTNKKLGVIGSIADKPLSKKIRDLATEIGQEIAKSGAILLFGFEGDFESVSSMAARAAEEVGGKTVAFIWGNKRQDLDGLRSKQVVTGQPRGGGREFQFVLSCDAVISMSGGSGTLMEIAMAYQANIPIIALKNGGGWSQKLAGKFLDQRKRAKIVAANSAKEAVNLAIQAASETLPFANAKSKI